MAARPGERGAEGRTLAGAAVVIPLRAFTGANTRLGAVLTEHERASLARSMADRVVAAAAPLPVVVVSSAPDVIEWADGHGCEVIADPGTLDGAAASGVQWARARGYSRAVVVHADLPLATSFDSVSGDGADPIAVIVPDHRNDGTPVLSIPTAGDFAFAYGPGSAARHMEAARAGGLYVRLVDDYTLAFDVDTVDDLDALTTRARDGSPD
jgi:2-phospho-L-lactate guanylyltransferase